MASLLEVETKIIPDRYENEHGEIIQFDCISYDLRFDCCTDIKNIGDFVTRVFAAHIHKEKPKIEVWSMIAQYTPPAITYIFGSSETIFQIESKSGLPDKVHIRIMNALTSDKFGDLGDMVRDYKNLEITDVHKDEPFSFTISERNEQEVTIDILAAYTGS